MQPPTPDFQEMELARTIIRTARGYIHLIGEPPRLKFKDILYNLPFVSIVHISGKIALMLK